MPALDGKQNITLRLSKQTIQKARVLAAKKGTSISGFMASVIVEMVEKEEDYERAMKRAMETLQKGFDMGEIPKLDRDALHERK